MHSQRWIQRGGGWVRSRARELSAPRRGRLHAASQLARKQMQARSDRPLCAGLPMCAQSSVQLVRAGARCVPAAASPSRVRQPFWMEPSFMSFLWCQGAPCGYARPAGHRTPSPNAARRVAGPSAVPRAYRTREPWARFCATGTCARGTQEAGTGTPHVRQGCGVARACQHSAPPAIWECLAHVRWRRSRLGLEELAIVLVERVAKPRR